MTFMGVVTMLATVVIAFYAFASHRLAKEMNRSTEQREEKSHETNVQHQEEIKDLYQAIVCAMIAGAVTQGDTSKARRRFNEMYKGKTRIFGD